MVLNLDVFFEVKQVTFNPNLNKSAIICNIINFFRLQFAYLYINNICE